MTIYVEDRGEYEFDFSIDKQVKLLADFTADYVKCPYDLEISMTMVTKDEIHRINKEHRNIDRPTDVLSFPMMVYDHPADFDGIAFVTSMVLNPETEELMLGDIVLCSQVVYEQAKEYGHSALREFSFLVVHSLLHLFGYDHIQEEDRLQMEHIQKDLLSKLHIDR